MPEANQMKVKLARVAGKEPVTRISVPGESGAYQGVELPASEQEFLLDVPVAVVAMREGNGCFEVAADSRIKLKFNDAKRAYEVEEPPAKS